MGAMLCSWWLHLDSRHRSDPMFCSRESQISLVFQKKMSHLSLPFSKHHNPNSNHSWGLTKISVKICMGSPSLRCDKLTLDGNSCLECSLNRKAPGELLSISDVWKLKINLLWKIKRWNFLLQQRSFLNVDFVFKMKSEWHLREDPRWLLHLEYMVVIDFCKLETNLPRTGAA